MFLLCAVSVLLAAAPDAGVPTVELSGAFVKPTTFSIADLKALGAVTQEWSDKTGPHRVTGVRLDALLLRAGFGEGAAGPKVDPKLKHEGVRAAVVATASDGFEAVFSVGELLGTLGPTTTLVVWEMDEKPLAPTLGPLRLVVPTDKLGTRSLYKLTSLRVVDLRHAHD